MKADHKRLAFPWDGRVIGLLLSNINFGFFLVECIVVFEQIVVHLLKFTLLGSRLAP